MARRFGRLFGRFASFASEAGSPVRVATFGAVGIAVGASSFAYAKENTKSIEPPAKISGQRPAWMKYPIISLDEVREDHGEDVWVTYEGGVYNVTAFLEAHPGGSTRIEMVAGHDLAKFWQVYNLHHRPHIKALLEEYRIGTLSEKDAKKAFETTVFSNGYKDDPSRPRKQELRIASEAPWNSEPQLERLVESFYTPNDLFFIRNHNAVPKIDAKTWSLEIEANPKAGLKERHFTLDQLKKNFPRVEVVAALQCAGNRQEDFVTEERPLYVAPHWRNGAIGCAKWAGVRVRDLLGAAGMDVDALALNKVKNNDVKIVNFLAEDMDETGTPYAGVLPAEKVIDPFGDAILAYEMNGETLPRDHGYPVRLLAPGHAGCRNVKWVRQISVSDKPSELDSGSRLDRHFAPDISWTDHRQHIAPPRCRGGECKEVRIDQGPVIQTLPVQSVICVPSDYSELSGASSVGAVEVKGIAWSGAGRGICRVEVSVDGGETFSAAELQREPVDAPSPEQGMGRNWAWVQFSTVIELPPHIKQVLARGRRADLEIISKAIDGDFNSQPEKMSQVWNVLGICVNHWSRVRVTLDPRIPSTDPPRVRPPPPPGSCVWPDCEPCSKDGTC